MSSVAARKKSIVSTNGLQIETPVAHNTFLNKSAAQSTSLYQQCAQLRASLMRIHDFAAYFAIASEARSSTDPVTQLWDCFALGVPLCFLHNLLPGVSPITIINCDPASIDPTDEKAVKKAILHFAMAVSNTDLVDQTEQFRATQLLDRTSTEGFVKVVNCVTRLVDRLPEELFEDAPPASPPIHSQGSSDSLGKLDSPVVNGASGHDAARNNIVRELVETERKYVQDLEHMQKYANALSTSGAIDQDTIHVLFPGLTKLLDFQRRFLIKLEGCAELPWKEQRWGLHFIENEMEFAVYEPYCANYTHAVEVLLLVQESLMTVTLMNARSELPAFLIKPVQRICKYPLLLESLLKASSPSEYPHYDELKAGCLSVKRVADRSNEAQRRAENIQTVQSLEQRVEDWKGHHLGNFGDLLLDDIFMVTKMDIDREYHVFLFEKIILCCKEVLIDPINGTRKVNKSNSILKKPSSTIGGLPGGVGPPKKRSTPLLLKGRIFLNNVTHVRPSNHMGQYSLQVWWRGDDDNEYFTLRCRTEEQLRQWEGQINRLIKETAARRASERTMSALAAHANSTNPALGGRQLVSGYEPNGRTMSMGAQMSYLQAGPGPSTGRRYSPPSPYDTNEARGIPSNVTPEGYTNGWAGPSGYPPDEGFEPDDDFEEYPPASSYPSSGRGTPLGVRRGNVAQSMFPERDVTPGYDRPRARTEDMNGPIMRQWRKNGHPMPPPPPPPIGGLPSQPNGAPAARPQPPRMSSDASFGPGIAPPPRLLRSQFSSSKLSSAYDHEGGRSTPPVMKQPPTSRSRSSSNPSAYHPVKAPAPPLPTSVWPERKGSVSTSTVSSVSHKRGSGSSGTSGSSDYSPHTSPITPFGSSESYLGGASLRNARSQTFGRMNNPTNGRAPQITMSTMVKVKVHFFEDIFVIQVPRTTEYPELVEKVGKKIRLCGPRREDGPLRVKYVDEDGDMVSLGSNEDVQMAFETLQPGSQVTLYVQ
ncbi:hypothetical protein BD410DRAFT_802027 [Rickenella mellea]|uniref:DH domain-containing protein n=1 Tax=Rickenella mellea TaxID=50990 RepID=A0A4Y7Q9W3_9AGAM|nr:hypothetical protein BD410DRAFT_802027 [Rickenella mellea]